METTAASPQVPGRAGIAGGIFLALGLAIAAVRLEDALVLFLPAALLAVPVVAIRILAQPVTIVAAFLFVSVNLDILTVGRTGVSLHIVFSSLLMWAIAVRLGLERSRPFRTPVERALLLFLGATLVSVALSIHPARSLKNWLRDVEYLILFAFLVDLKLRARDRRILAGTVVLSCLIPCLAGLLGIVFDLPRFYGLDTPIAGGEIIRRVYGTLRHPVSLSIYLALTATITLSLLLNGRWFRRTYLLPLLALQWVVLYLTYGRTGWVVMIVSAAALLWISGRRRWLLFGLPAALGAMVLLVPRFLARWQTAWSPEGDSFLWRIGLWAYTLTLIPRHLLFGSGPDTFTEYVAYGSGRASHQTWIGLALETGLVGVAAFLVLVIVIIVSLGRRMRQTVWRHDPLARAAVAGFWGVLAGSLAENPFEVPVIATLVWILLALALNERSAPETAAGP